MTLATIEKLDKEIILTVGEAKHLSFTLSYMTRSVKVGIKKMTESRQDYRQKYNSYIELRNYMIDQIKDFKNASDNELIEITIKEENIDVLKEFVHQQINLFNDLLLKSKDDLNKSVHKHIVPLQTIAFKLN